MYGSSLFPACLWILQRTAAPGLSSGGFGSITDFDYELQLAQTNRIMNAEVDTLFLATSLEYAYLSSSTVKEVASYGGDVSKFVPPFVVDKIYNKIWSKKNQK